LGAPTIRVYISELLLLASTFFFVFWKGTTVDTLVFQYLNLLVGESKRSYNGSLSFNQPRECDCASGAP
jgi:hypothetical protein